MKRNFITHIQKKRILLMVVAAIMLCTAGTNCLADASPKKSAKVLKSNNERSAEIYPVKKAVYGKETIAASGVHYTRKEKGNLSIKMKKGYILKNIQLGVKMQGNKIIYRKIKNNSKVSLGKLYELYAGSAVIKITYSSPDSAKKKQIYLHIYKI